MVSNGHIVLDGLVFDCVRTIPFMVTVGCVRDKASVCPHVYDDIVMHVIVRGDVFEFICCGRTKNGIMFCESFQDWFDIVAMSLRMYDMRESNCVGFWTNKTIF